jgi:glycosyltransferase involved in cell wall biosynthesis
MPEKLERLLVVAFRYPPFAEVGAKRWTKLSKYLARQGVEVHVVTVPWGPETPEDMRDVTHPNIHIHRIPSLVPNRIQVTTPPPHSLIERARNRLHRTRIAGRYWANDAVLWGPAVIPAVAWLSRRHRVQAIVVTGGPFWAGYWVGRGKRLYPRVPLIQEFRDPWLELPDSLLDRQGGRDLVEQHEKALIHSADAIVTVTKGLSELIRAKADSTPVYTITNGFDPEEIPWEIPAGPRPFRLIHGGNIGLGREEPLRALMSAVSELLPEIPDVELVFRGVFPADVRSEFGHLEDAGVLKVLERIPGPEFMREVAESFATLQFNAERFPYALSTKIFEYAASGRPVLSVNYGGEVDSLVRQHGLGWSTDVRMPDSVIAALRALRQLWLESPAFSLGTVQLESLSYEYIVRDYSQLIRGRTQ